MSGPAGLSSSRHHGALSRARVTDPCDTRHAGTLCDATGDDDATDRAEPKEFAAFGATESATRARQGCRIGSDSRKPNATALCGPGEGPPLGANRLLYQAGPKPTGTGGT